MESHTEDANDSGGPKRELTIEITKNATAVYFKCTHPSCQWKTSCAAHSEREYREHSDFIKPEVTFSYDSEEAVWSIQCLRCIDE